MKKVYICIAIIACALLPSLVFNSVTFAMTEQEASDAAEGIVTSISKKWANGTITKLDYQAAIAALQGLPAETTCPSCSGTVANIISVYQELETNFSTTVTATQSQTEQDLCARNPTSPACNTDNNLAAIIKIIVNALLFALGATCAVVVVIGGIRFVTSGGDASAVTSAKNSILYGVIGILIAFSAFGVVNFVIERFK